MNRHLFIVLLNKTILLMNPCIGQQLDHIEEIVEKTAVSKREKSLIDLPIQREKVNFKTSQTKTL